MSMFEETDGFQFSIPGPTLFTVDEIQELGSLFEPSGTAATSNSGSDESVVAVRPAATGTSMSGRPMDDRKRKRMESNRLSAMRSRMKKKRHVENLMGQVNRLRLENRELGSRVRLLAHQECVVRGENQRLQLEHDVLVQRLLALYRALEYSMQLQL